MPHKTFPKNEEADNQLRELCDQDLFPIPEGFDYLNFEIDESIFQPKSDRSIEDLEAELIKVKENLANIEKQKYILYSVVIPSFHEELLTPLQYSFIYTFNVLGSISCQYSASLNRSILYLMDNLESKKQILEKNREKRKRYKNNKKNARDCISQSSNKL